jgi:N-acetylmuramoyl-L-alanine amidase
VTDILGETRTSLQKALDYARSVDSVMDCVVPVFSTYWFMKAQGHPVRPEVAAAQSLVETGRFHFGRMVDPRYKNPCGMRTGVIMVNEGEVPCNHERYKDWNDGCCAHLDHLALYAGAGGFPATGRTRDPRHFPYLFGTCKTVESLGIWTGSKDNVTYGASILKHMNGMIS